MQNSLLGRSMPTAMTYMMGCHGGEWAAEYNYSQVFGESARFLERRFGCAETLCPYNSYQLLRALRRYFPRTK